LRSLDGSSTTETGFELLICFLYSSKCGLSLIPPPPASLSWELDLFDGQFSDIEGEILNSLLIFSPDSTARDTKIFAYQAIGLLASRMPNLFRHDIFLNFRGSRFSCVLMNDFLQLYFTAAIKPTWLYDSLLL
jgi:hypothetical protein